MVGIVLKNSLLCSLSFCFKILESILTKHINIKCPFYLSLAVTDTTCVVAFVFDRQGIDGQSVFLDLQ